MITFKLKRHDLRAVEVVEILDGDHLLGVLYPQEWGVRLVSKYLDPASIGIDPTIPPALEVRLP